MCQRAISLYVALRTIVGDTYTERDEISVGQFISYCLCHLEFIGSSNESRLPESLTQVNARKIRTLVFPKLTIRSLYPRRISRASRWLYNPCLDSEINSHLREEKYDLGPSLVRYIIKGRRYRKSCNSNSATEADKLVSRSC